MDQLTASHPARPVILCLSKAGLAIARRLAEVIDADIHGHAIRCPDAPHHFGKATPHIADLFCSGRPVIGICAAGILIRAVAPHLRHKGTDAPVIAVAESGNVAVPLVGGALVGGASLDADAFAAICTAAQLASRNEG